MSCFRVAQYELQILNFTC